MANVTKKRLFARFFRDPEGVGQFASDYVAIGQIVLAKMGQAQLGFAESLWSSSRGDPEAGEFFKSLWNNIRQWLSW